MLEWTAIGKKRRYTFTNPQHALYDRMAAVRLLTGEVPVEGRMLFTLRSEFPKGKPRNVLRIDDLTRRNSRPSTRRAATSRRAFGDVVGEREEQRRAESARGVKQARLQRLCL